MYVYVSLNQIFNNYVSNRYLHNVRTRAAEIDSFVVIHSKLTNIRDQVIQFLTILNKPGEVHSEAHSIIVGIILWNNRYHNSGEQDLLSIILCEFQPYDHTGLQF